MRSKRIGKSTFIACFTFSSVSQEWHLPELRASHEMMLATNVFIDSLPLDQLA